MTPQNAMPARIGLAGAALLFLASCSLQDYELTLGVSTEEPAPSIAETIRSQLGAQGFTISIEETAVLSGIVNAVRDGELDLAVVDEPRVSVPGVVTLAPLYPSILHILHNRGAVTEDFAELIRGSSIYPGPVGSAGYRLLMQLADDFGVAADQYQLLENPWTVNPDVYFIFGGLLSDESLRQLSGYRLFSFVEADSISGGSVADGIVLRHHHLKPFLLPKSIYHTLNNDTVLTLSIRSVLIANENLDSDTAYDIASSLFNDAQEIALNYPLVMRELSDDLNPADLMFPLHEGARRYLDREAPGMIERYADVIALGVTLLLTAFSGAFAYSKRRQQIKKDRVDVYYSQLLEIRHGMDAAPDKAAFRACHQRALGVQREVLDLVVNERIAADNSLIAFISLSNQIVNELERRIGVER